MTFTKEEFEAVVEHFAMLQKWQREEDAKVKANQKTENETLSNQFESGVSASELSEVEKLSNWHELIGAFTFLGKANGETGIRTLVTISDKHAFQACAFSHSAISPWEHWV